MKLPLTKKNWYVILFFTMLIWGTLSPVTRYLSFVSQEVLALLRLASASVLLLIITFSMKKDLKIEKHDIPKTLIVSILAGYLAPIMYNFGIQKTSSIVGAILVNTNPLFVPLFSLILLKEKFVLRRFFYVAIGFLGVVLLFYGNNFTVSFQSDYFLGLLLLLAASLCVATSSVLCSPLVKKYGGVKIATYYMVVGTILMLIQILITGEISKISAFSFTSLLLSIYIGIFPTAITWFLFLASLNSLSPVEATSFKLLIPVFAAIFSIILLKEVLTFNLIIGGIIVMASIYLVQKSSQKKITHVE